MIRDPDVPFFTRLRGQGGFALTEAIAAAAVLALLSLGVLAGIDGAASSTGREKARSTASSLAEEDQERLHSIPANNLPELRERKDVPVGGITYTVASEADWISDANGSTVSCTSEGGKADYLRLRTTVTSKTVGTSTKPVVLESIVAPPVGSAGGNNGTLAVQVLDRDKVGVTNVTVGISGETGGHTATKKTNAVGCAIFAMIPADTYATSINVPGWVDPGGVTAVNATGIVSPGGTTITSLLYDKRAQVTTGFDTLYYRYNGSSPGWVTQASRAWALSLENSDVPGSGIRTFADTSGAVDPLTVQTGTNLFPFADGYGIYAGKCAEQNPAATVANQPWATINAHQVTERNTTYDRTTGAAAPLRMPALPARVYRGTTTNNNPYGNANVMARLVVPAPPSGEDPLCTDELQSQVQNTTWGLESYPSGRSMSGTSPGFTNGMTGFVTKIAGAGGTEFDPGLPFGVWRVCADDGTRSVVAQIDNTKPDGPRKADNSWDYTKLLIPSSGTNSANAGTCQTRAAW
jgi:hypothetical protein